MIAAQKLDILGRFLAAHPVADDLEYAFKARCRHNMQKLLRYRIAESVGVSDSLHILVCIFNFDAHKFIDKIVKPRAV